MLYKSPWALEIVSIIVSNASTKDSLKWTPTLIEPIHLQLDLELDLEKLKRKSLMRYFALAIFRYPDPVQMIFEGPVASVLFIFTFQYRICNISHLLYISHMQYCKCEIITSKGGEVLKKKN